MREKDDWVNSKVLEVSLSKLLVGHIRTGIFILGPGCNRFYSEYVFRHFLPARLHPYIVPNHELPQAQAVLNSLGLQRVPWASSLSLSFSFQWSVLVSLINSLQLMLPCGLESLLKFTLSTAKWKCYTDFVKSLPLTVTKILKKGLSAGHAIQSGGISYV